MASLFAEEEEEIPDAGVEHEVDAAAPPAAAEVSPRAASDLLGHEAVEKMLLADFNASRMPHAIVIAGLPGIGKATLAFRLARFLLSQAEQGAGLFGEPEKPETLYIKPDDPVFRRVASGGHADLLVVEREFDEKKGRLKQDISAESVRKITPFLRKTAAEGGWRVVIVDGAEYLNRTSQNALLKILEEPPTKTVLMLTTTQPGAFLPTIRSRCRMISLDPLPETAVAALLDKYAPGLSAEEKSALCRLSEGSIGRALQFHLDKGVELYRELLTALSALPALDLVKAHDLSDKLSRAEAQYDTARDILTGWCLRLAQAEARGTALADVLPGDAAIFRQIQSSFPPRHFLDLWERMAQLFRQADGYTLDRKQALLAAFLMLHRPDYTGPNI